MYVLFSKKKKLWYIYNKEWSICKGIFVREKEKELKIQKTKRQGQYGENIGCNEWSKYWYIVFQ